MSAVTKNLTIEKGATFQHRFTWQDANGDPVELVTLGYTARMHIRKKKSSTTPTLTLAGPVQGSAQGVIVLDDLGNIDLQIPAASTAAVADKSGFYDLELEDTNDIVTRLVEGTITYSEEVTK